MLLILISQHIFDILLGVISTSLLDMLMQLIFVTKYLQCTNLENINKNVFLYLSVCSCSADHLYSTVSMVRDIPRPYAPLHASKALPDTT